MAPCVEGAALALEDARKEGGVLSHVGAAGVLSAGAGQLLEQLVLSGGALVRSLASPQLQAVNALLEAAGEHTGCVHCGALRCSRKCPDQAAFERGKCDKDAMAGKQASPRSCRHAPGRLLPLPRTTARRGCSLSAGPKHISTTTRSCVRRSLFAGRGRAPHA